MTGKRFFMALGMAGLLLLGACQSGSRNNVSNSSSKQPSAVIQNADTANTPVMTFVETVHNFGKLTQGEIVKYDFHFKNTGKSDLRITRVSTSCGCTVGKYPHQPVKPGEEGDIEVTFNSSHKRGYQNKSVMLLANTNPVRTVLRIKAVVELPKDDDGK
jgi:hypothetical protein